jgi:hypothetical protein
LADLPPPPPDLDPDPDPHQDFELDPDPAPDPHQNNADPQPWAQLSKDCCLIFEGTSRRYLLCRCRRSWHTTYIHRSKRRFLLAKMSITFSRSMSIERKQTCIFFLLPTASSFLINSLSGWGGGGCTWPGGCTGGGGEEGDARASCASPLGTPLHTRAGLVLLL